MTYSRDELIKMREDLYNVPSDIMSELLDQLIETMGAAQGALDFYDNIVSLEDLLLDRGLRMSKLRQALPPAPEMPSASRSE